ncbi:MAG TPA: fructose-bisphosphatase class II, partial [Candidatus Krumholzibacterium sp.]|nr:fructose-bisphosphatase class II [Candidatus Krumholzibacterium sp.]
MDRNLALELVRVTEAAALASARYMGKGDPQAADNAAVEAMEIAFRGIRIDGRVVIGDDDTAEDCSLRSGGSVGEGGEIRLDLVVDPLESKHSLADGQANAISAIAVGQTDSFYPYRHEYMEKIAVGPDAAFNIDLSASVF